MTGGHGSERSAAHDFADVDRLSEELGGLPNDAASSLQPDGRRNIVHPADVRGRFSRLRRLLFFVLIAIYAGLPWIRIGGHPALMLDIEHRRFFILGGSYNSQDFWLVFFLLSGLGFLLIVITTLLGRVWCGYACPQTVFLEGVYRRIERWIEGPRATRLRRNAGPWNLGKISRKLVKQALFVAVSFAIAHAFLSYFVSLPAVFKMVRENPSAHPLAFAWAMGLTAVIYFNFAWFREQLCLIICPYGRLQSVLTDQDSLVVGYDVRRGEPRGKASSGEAGDCIDCKRCVAVCPTGIDIRNGLQLDCIGCSACIDACDEIMDRIKRPRGLVRYDSLAGLAGETRRIWRPRLAVYLFLGLAGLAALSVAISSHDPYEVKILRMAGPPFSLDNELVRNTFEVHVVNKYNDEQVFEIEPADPATGRRIVIAVPSFSLPSLKDQRVPVFVTVERAAFQPGEKVSLVVRARDIAGSEQQLEAPLLGPMRLGTPRTSTRRPAAGGER